MFMICTYNYKGQTFKSEAELNDFLLEKDKYLLSCKDLNTLDYIEELLKLGINSLKIEVLKDTVVITEETLEELKELLTFLQESKKTLEEDV